MQFKWIIAGMLMIGIGITMPDIILIDFNQFTGNAESFWIILLTGLGVVMMMKGGLG